MPALAADPRKILIIKPSSIGDVVHTLPVWNLLRECYPSSEISWLIAPACAGIVEKLPGIKLLRFDRAGWSRAWRSISSARSLVAFHSQLRAEHFDLVLDAQGLFRSGWFASKTHAPVRVGFANAREMAWMFYTHRVPIETLEQHAVARYLKLLEAIGCPSAPVEFPLPITDADRAAAFALVSDAPRFAILCPGANWLTKRWPVDRFAQLVPAFQQKFGLPCVVAGGPADRQLAAQIPGARDLCGQTTLMQLAALMERASLIVTNDSGPMHIAAALHRPLVAIFGPTNPVRTGPYGSMQSVVRANESCAPCYRRHCPHCRCMTNLTVETVLAAAERQLARPAASV